MVRGGMLGPCSGERHRIEHVLEGNAARAIGERCERLPQKVSCSGLRERGLTQRGVVQKGDLCQPEMHKGFGFPRC